MKKMFAIGVIGLFLCYAGVAVAGFTVYEKFGLGMFVCGTILFGIYLLSDWREKNAGSSPK